MATKPPWSVWTAIVQITPLSAILKSAHALHTLGNVKLSSHTRIWWAQSMTRQISNPLQSSNSTLILWSNTMKRPLNSCRSRKWPSLRRWMITFSQKNNLPSFRISGKVDPKTSTLNSWNKSAVLKPKSNPIYMRCTLITISTWMNWKSLQGSY